MPKFETNLIRLYSVQPASGLDSKWFITREEAKNFYDQCMAEVEAAFAAWEKGEQGNDNVVSSRLEGDGFGGCHQYFMISDHALPSLEEHDRGTLRSKPKSLPKQYWGNPATARPVRH